MIVPKARIRERVTNRMVCERVNFWGNGVPLRSCLNCLRFMVGFLSLGLAIPGMQSNVRSKGKGKQMLPPNTLAEPNVGAKTCELSALEAVEGTMRATAHETEHAVRRRIDHGLIAERACCAAMG